MDGFDEASPDALPLRFAGVKVYPPLGFDPWPEDGGELEKVRILYEFCEKRGIPITTHCDDQGFRVIPLEEAWSYAAPARWEGVLASYPGLTLDFAHFGTQYSRPVGRGKARSLREVLLQSTEWTQTIIRFMDEYPRVYTDISFNGCDPSYYAHLSELLGRLPAAMRDLVASRIMFGSDFVVSLTKVRSYADYYRHYAASGLSDEWKRLFGHDNPEAFLTGK